MSDFSKPPLDVLRDSQDKGYTGIHIEQGVPILDRDLNLLHDILASRMKSIFSRYIGNGIPSAVDGFAIHGLPDGQNTNNFQIAGPGTCLVDGTEVTIAASTDYNNQPNAGWWSWPQRPAPLPGETPRR